MNRPHAIEQTFLDHLDALERDSVRAASFVYTLGAFNHLFGSDPDLRDRINDHAAFWIACMSGLQAAGFVALGRMYDNGTDAHHINGLLKAAETARGVFSRQALEERKVSHGLSRADAHGFALEASEFDTKAFDKVRKEAELCHKIYEARVQPIRHRVYAHANKTAREQIEALFANLLDRALERVTTFPLQLHDAFRHAYLNGKPLALREAPSNVVDIVRQGLPEYTTTWEHVHSVDAVAKFLQEIRKLD